MDDFSDTEPVDDEDGIAAIYSYDGESVSVEWLMEIDPPDWETNDRLPEGFVEVPIDTERHGGRGAASDRFTSPRGTELEVDR